MNGIELIAAERQRQVSLEGYSAKHDDTHAKGELAMAAVCYAANEPVYVRDQYVNNGVYFCDPWPFESEWDKRPVDDDDNPVFEIDSDVRIRQLVKAGALIAAEIDRLQRAMKGGGDGR